MLSGIPFWLWIIILELLEIAVSLRFYLGDCPVHFEEPCNTNTVKFILSVGGKNQSYHYLDPLQPQLPRGYNVLNHLKIVIHGYGGLEIDSASRNVSQAYQDVGYNVIIVDWGPLSLVPCYFAAYLNTWHVGHCLSILVFHLMALGVEPRFTHVVGFSLGAHVAGYAGRNLKNSQGYSFMRITGLDPALPLFATFNNDWKLDSSDASFVDVIHTSAGTFGKVEEMGHVDFYVNGGSLQPFCYEAKYPPICSHLLAGVYFAESIRNRRTYFIGIECSNILNYYFGFCNSGNIAVMGEFVSYTPSPKDILKDLSSRSVPREATGKAFSQAVDSLTPTAFRIRGIYAVRTSDKPPFALSLI